MRKFEYEVFKIELKTPTFGGKTVKEAELKERLNQLGKDGWELVTKIDSHKDGSTDSVFLLFKREI